MPSFRDRDHRHPAVEFVPVGRLPEIGDRWQALEERCGPVPVMRSWTWTSAWVRAYADEVDCRAAFVTVDGETIGATLVTAGTARRGPVPLRVRWLGTGDLPVDEEAFPDENGPVSLPGREREVVAALVGALEAEGGWDELRLTGAVEADARRFAAGRPRHRVRAQVLEAPHHDLALQPAGGDPTASLRRSHRRNARRTLHAWERRGDLTTEWATDAEGALAILDELIALHQARWTADGLPGGFATARTIAFHRELVARLIGDGRVALTRVRCAGETVATTYAFVDGDHLRSYQTGLVPPPGGRLRPGALGDLLTMAEARRHGIARYDFLPGSPEYKRALSTGAGRRWRVALRGRRGRLLVVDALSVARTVLRRLRRRPAPAEPGWTRLPPG